MTSYDLTELLFQELGYWQSPGFSHAAQNASVDEMWRDIRPVPHIDGIYRIQETPVVYFGHLDDADPVLRKNLHRRVWNQSKVPLLYVVLPQEIRVYNSYSVPAETVDEFDKEGRLLQCLDQLTDIETARQKIRQELVARQYDRLNLDIGAFWSTDDGRLINRQDRADQRLLRDMEQLRRGLRRKGLPNDVAYAVLGRSILIRYLEDRNILNPDILQTLTNGKTKNYIHALKNLDTAYTLFIHLSQRFNGDLFPVSRRERTFVRQEHLDLLGAFLGQEDLESGQMSLWPYDFRYVPIELISGIYDTFLQTSERRQSGTYYTPLPLVEFLLDETMPPETIHPDMTVLDPACGSGVFLVRAYQRLVNAWRRQHSDVHPTAQQLAKILQHSIFGVDKAPEATRIAAFGLYLAMLDHLEDQAILDPDFRFPPLQGTNLITSDFFDPEIREIIGERRFDRVIGNPPWGKGGLTPYAQEAMRGLEFPIGDKQIVQAFLAYAPRLCARDGEIALLAPTKSTIHVGKSTHESFRQRFFEQYKVRAIVNFSALRHELFKDIKHPALAIFYRPILPQLEDCIAYGTPKPSPLSQQLGAVVLDATEVKYLEREDVLNSPLLWKVALWGTHRDASLIKRLTSFPTLQDQVTELGWPEPGEGIQIKGGESHPAEWLTGMLFLPTTHFKRYIVDREACKPIQATFFNRHRRQEIIRGPLALIRHGPVDGRCVAALSIEDIAYSDSISGIPGRIGPELILKWLVAYLNSPLAQYYQFMTSTRWGVERDPILHKEFLSLPFVIPELDSPELRDIEGHFDQITTLMHQSHLATTQEQLAAIRGHEEAIAELVFDIYDLTPAERQLVRDTVEYTIDFFYWSQKAQRRPGTARSVQPPDATMLKGYADTFVDTVTSLMRYQGQTLDACVYYNDVPLSVAAFEIVTATRPRETRTIESASELQKVLVRLDRQLLEERAPGVYMRRHVRIYDGARLYLVRPSERRFWTRSQAYVDADDIIVEWLSSRQLAE